MKNIHYDPGTIKIRTRNLQVVEKTSKGWKVLKDNFEPSIKIIKIFKSLGNLKLIIDPKDPRFLKGGISSEGKIIGSKINILPTKEKLSKAYSLFSPGLRIHDESSHAHWDLMFQNPNGSYAYLYTLRKQSDSKKRKYNIEKKFENIYSKLSSNIYKSLDHKNNLIPITLYTLLATKMRVGSEKYYLTHKHQGLTTLRKKDLKINNQKNEVSFNFIAKDGVPMNIIKKLDSKYIQALKTHLKKIKANEFIFSNLKTKHPLTDTQLKKGFEEYCGYPFYPHIVRSYYATKKTRGFLKENKNPSKKEVSEFFLKIAHELGHKKFSKKNKQWQENASVTIQYYIDPKLVQRINKKIKKS